MWKLSLWTHTERVLLSFTFLGTTKCEKSNALKFFFLIFSVWTTLPLFAPYFPQSELCSQDISSLTNLPKWLSQKQVTQPLNFGVLKTTRFSFPSILYRLQGFKNFVSAKALWWQFQNLKTKESFLKFMTRFKNNNFDRFMWSTIAPDSPALNFSQPVLSSN